MREALIGQRATVMEQAECALHPLFHEDVSRPHTVLDLVELAAVGHGPIPP